jgi:chaperonin GroEL (HSP60 family)
MSRALDDASSTISTEEQTRASLLAAAVQLETLALTSYGPQGRFKVLQSNEECTGSITVTTSSKHLFTRTSLGLNSAAAQVLVDLASAQEQTFSDGGLFVVAFAARLVRVILAEESAVPRPIAHRGIQLALQWMEEFLQDRRCPCRAKVRWSDMGAMTGTITLPFEHDCETPPDVLPMRPLFRRGPEHRGCQRCLPAAAAGERRRRQARAPRVHHLPR